MESRHDSEIRTTARVAVLCCFAAALCAQGQEQPASALANTSAGSPLPADPAGTPGAPVVAPPIPVQPVSVKQKLTRAAKETVEWTVPLVAAGSAGIDQLTDQNPSLGQGGEGFGKRFYRYYADEAMKRFLVDGVLSSAFHQETHYSRRGQGAFWNRVGYAASRVIITRSDSSKTQFNYSEVVGVSATLAISTAYFPGYRNASDTFQRISFDLAGDAACNVFREFWPDLKRKFAH